MMFGAEGRGAVGQCEIVGALELLESHRIVTELSHIKCTIKAAIRISLVKWLRVV